MKDREGHNTLQTLLASIAVVASVWISGSVGMQNGFLHYDDPDVIIDNPRLKTPALTDAVGLFSEVRDHAYLPFYYLALMPDASIGKGSARAYHAGSLVWHSLNALLVFFLIRGLTRSAFLALAVALIFAVHPVAVESVAWASGRKDQASLFGLLLGLIQWRRFVVDGSVVRGGFASVCFLIASFAKGTVVVFPVLAWLVAWSAQDRSSQKLRMAPHIGLVALALIPVIVHLKVAASEGTALAASASTVGEGALSLLVALGRYAENLLFPLSLSIHYAIPSNRGFGAPEALGVFVIGLLLSLAFVGFRRNYRFLLLGSLWVLASLLPFNNMFPRTSIPMADRYLHVGLVGFALLLALTLNGLPRSARNVALVLIVAGLGVLTHIRTLDFRDGESVFRGAMKVEPKDPFPPMAVAEAILLKVEEASDEDPRYREAIALFSQSLDLAQRAGNPVPLVKVQVRLGDALLRLGRATEAAEHFSAAKERVDQNPALYTSLNLKRHSLEHNLAVSFIKLGKLEEARVAIDKILVEDPTHGEGRLTRAQLDLVDGMALLYGGLKNEPQSEDSGRALIDGAMTSLAALRSQLVALVRGEEPRAQADLLVLVTSELGRAYLSIPHLKEGILKALPLAEDLIARFPNRGEGYALRASVRDRVGEDKAMVLADLLQAIHLDSRNVDYLLRSSALLQSAGEHRRAHDFLLRAKRVAGTSKEVDHALGTFLLSMAHSHRQRGSLDPAQKAAEEAVAHDPSLAEGHQMIGEILLARPEGKDWEGARQRFEQVLKLNPNHDEAAHLLAGYYQARGIRVLAELERRTEGLQGEDRRLAREALQDSLVADFRRALALSPGADNLAIARNYLRDTIPVQREASSKLVDEGYRTVRGGDTIAGLEILIRAVRTDGSNVEARWLLSEVLHKQERSKEAGEHLLVALGLDPEHLACLALAARVFYVQGDEVRAREFADRFLRLSLPYLPNDTLAEERDRVQKIRALLP